MFFYELATQKERRVSPYLYPTSLQILTNSDSIFSNGAESYLIVESQ